MAECERTRTDYRDYEYCIDCGVLLGLTIDTETWADKFRVKKEK